MEIHPIDVPFPYIVLFIPIYLSTQLLATGKMPSSLTTHPRARPSPAKALQLTAHPALPQRAALQGEEHGGRAHSLTRDMDRQWGGKEQRQRSRTGTPAAQLIPTVISAAGFSACAGLLQAQVPLPPASRGWMSPLLPGTLERYLQPSSQEPFLQLKRLSFPQAAATTTKAALAEHAALFPPPASPLES